MHMLKVTLVHEHMYKIIVEHDLYTLPDKKDVQHLIFNCFLNTEFVNLSCINPAYKPHTMSVKFPAQKSPLSMCTGIN